MFSTFQTHIPTDLFFGQGLWSELKLKDLNILCVCSPSVMKKESLISSFQTAALNGRSSINFLEKTSGEPDSDTIDDLFQPLHHEYDLVIGIGGGSILDTAKYLAMLLVSGGSCLDYEFGARSVQGSVPTLLVPTTSGSGSELTPYSVVKNSRTGRKFTINHPSLFPRTAYVDPGLTLGLPYYYSLATGLDAFIHNLEVLLNKIQNPLVTPVALSGLELGYRNLPHLLEGQNDIDLRTKLSLASVMGGYSISQTRTGLIHTLSVALSEVSDAAHGILNAYILPFALRSNLPHYNGKLASIMNHLLRQPVESDEEAFGHLAKWNSNLLSFTENVIVNGVDVEENMDHLVDRVLQDQGLQEVNSGKVHRSKLIRIFEEMVSDAT